MSYLKEEHEEFRRSLRDFLNKEVVPFVDEWEKNQEIPRSIWKKFGDMGYFGIPYAEKYGGMDLDFRYTIIFFEEMSKVNSAGVGAAIGTHVYLSMSHINNEGNEEQKMKYLSAGIAGDKFGCLGITEPFGGSDVASIRTTAVLEGDEYVINGSKTFITNGVLSDFLVIAAKTDPELGGAGISMFLIDRDTPGVSATKLKKLGWDASDTGEIAFSDVRVPASALLGQEGSGFLYIMQQFALERLGMAVGAVASSQFALDYAINYMKERTAFGRSISRFQELRHRVAQLASEIEMQRQFVYHICERYGNEEYVVKEAAMAKLLCTQLSDKVATECLQFLGGYGFMEEYPMARNFRDSRLGPIGGGTNEIMKEILAKMIIDDVSY